MAEQDSSGPIEADRRLFTVRSSADARRWLVAERGDE